MEMGARFPFGFRTYVDYVFDLQRNSIETDSGDRIWENLIDVCPVGSRVVG